MKALFNYDNCIETDYKCKTTNAISLLVGVISLLAYGIVVAKNILIDYPVPFLDLARLLFISAFSFFSYFLHRRDFKTLSKFILIYSFLSFVIYYPVVIESYRPNVSVLYPLFIVLLGVLTQIMFYFPKEKFSYIFVMISLLVSLYLSDSVYSLSFEELDLKKEWGLDYFVIKIH